MAPITPTVGLVWNCSQPSQEEAELFPESQSFGGVVVEHQVTMAAHKHSHSPQTAWRAIRCPAGHTVRAGGEEEEMAAPEPALT